MREDPEPARRRRSLAVAVGVLVGVVLGVVIVPPILARQAIVAALTLPPSAASAELRRIAAERRLWAGTQVSLIHVAITQVGDPLIVVALIESGRLAPEARDLLFQMATRSMPPSYRAPIHRALLTTELTRGEQQAIVRACVDEVAPCDPDSVGVILAWLEGEAVDPFALDMLRKRLQAIPEPDRARVQAAIARRG